MHSPNACLCILKMCLVTSLLNRLECDLHPGSGKPRYGHAQPPPPPPLQRARGQPVHLVEVPHPANVLEKVFDIRFDGLMHSSVTLVI